MTKQYLYIALCCLLFLGVAVTQPHKASWAVDAPNLQIWNAKKVDWWVSMDDEAAGGGKQGCEIHWLYDDALDLSLSISDQRRLYYNFVVSKERINNVPSINYNQADSAYLVIDKVKNPLAISRGQSSQVIMALPSNLNDINFIKDAERLLLKIGGTIYNFPLENADENFAYFQKCMDTLNIQIASSAPVNRPNPKPLAASTRAASQPTRATPVFEAPPPKPMFMPEVAPETVRAPANIREEIVAPTKLTAPRPLPVERSDIYPEVVDNQTLYHDVKKLNMFSPSSERVIVSQKGDVYENIQQSANQQPEALYEDQPARSSRYDPSIYGQPVEAQPLMPAPTFAPVAQLPPQPPQLQQQPQLQPQQPQAVRRPIERPVEAVSVEQKTAEELEIPPFVEADKAENAEPIKGKNSKQFDSMLKDIERSETQQKKETGLKDQLLGGTNACNTEEYNGENTAIIQNLTRKLMILEREKEELRTKLIGSGNELIQDVAACNTPIDENLDEPLSDEVIEKFEDTINKLRAENELLREASVEGDGEESSALEDEIDGLQQQINGLIERNNALQDENFDLQKGIESAAEKAAEKKQSIDKVKELLDAPIEEEPIRSEIDALEENVSDTLSEMEALSNENLNIMDKFEDLTGEKIEGLADDVFDTNSTQP